MTITLVFTAVRLYAKVLSTHPFLDGNGRTAFTIQKTIDPDMGSVRQARIERGPRATHRASKLRLSRSRWSAKSLSR